MGEWFRRLVDDLAAEHRGGYPSSDRLVTDLAPPPAGPAPGARLSLAGPPWWRCPNVPPCAHGQIMHDVEEYAGDGTDTCCAEGCDCRGPNARTLDG